MAVSLMAPLASLLISTITGKEVRKTDKSQESGSHFLAPLSLKAITGKGVI